MNKDLPSLNALRAFEAAARLGSLVKAADELGVTSAAVSQQLKSLEDRCGVRLLRRQGQRMELTEAGRAYWPLVNSALTSLWDGMCELFGGGDQNLIRLRVGVSFALSWLAPRLPRLYARHPGLRLRMTVNPWPNEQPVGGIDLEIANSYGDSAGRQVERLTREHWMVVASPEFLARHPVPENPAALLKLPLIGVMGYRGEGWPQWFRHAGVELARPLPLLECDSTQVALEATQAGLGLLLARSLLLKFALRDGRLRQAHPLTMPSHGGHFLIIPRELTRKPEVLAFRQWLRNELAAEGELATDGD
ncbi:MAG TPA: LysR substrate-binding domain-containing protein [Candidatus Competibacteraceae bacterium]|nr:LysR substrate-binding domain-containing protein [Candidatus Competibacteraceae bacterium]